MNKLFNKIVFWINFLQQFFTKDIWRKDFSKLSHARAVFYQQLLIGYLVGRAFVQDRLLVRASALVYATLLSMVPLLAVMFALLKGFGVHNKLETTLYRLMEPLGKHASEVVIPPIVQFVDNVNVGALGGVGLLLLFLSTLSIINNIERAFNDVWKISQVRNFKRRVSEYLSVLLISPILIFAVLGITASLQSNAIIQVVSHLPGIAFLFNKIAPILVSWLIFFLLFLYIPNTKVRIDSALIGAVLAGTIWQLVNFFFANFLVKSYQFGSKAAIYAGFATLPLFLVWIYLAWAVILMGAEISYSHQNLNKLTWEFRSSQYSQLLRQSLALKIILSIGQKFYHGEQVPSNTELADHFNVPERLVNEILTRLVDNSILYPLEGKVNRYAPARSLETMKVTDIIFGLQASGVSDWPQVEQDSISEIVHKIQTEYKEIIQEKFVAITVRDLVLKIKET